jgi:hypothetical protein
VRAWRLLTHTTNHGTSMASATVAAHPTAAEHNMLGRLYMRSVMVGCSNRREELQVFCMRCAGWPLAGACLQAGGGMLSMHMPSACDRQAGAAAKAGAAGRSVHGCCMRGKRGSHLRAAAAGRGGAAASSAASTCATYSSSQASAGVCTARAASMTAVYAAPTHHTCAKIDRCCARARQHATLL